MSNFAKVRSRIRTTADEVSSSALANDNIRIAVKYVATDKLIPPERQLKK
jgi:hypothetical protein